MLTHLGFANDKVPFAKTSQDLNKKEKTGLKLKTKKTKIMTNGKKNQIRLEQAQIDFVDEYIYLQQSIALQYSNTI